MSININIKHFELCLKQIQTGGPLWEATLAVISLFCVYYINSKKKHLHVTLEIQKCLKTIHNLEIKMVHHGKQNILAAIVGTAISLTNISWFLVDVCLSSTKCSISSSETSSHSDCIVQHGAAYYEFQLQTIKTFIAEAPEVRSSCSDIVGSS